MIKTALKENETLKITKGKKYEVYTLCNGSILGVVNDNGDYVLMSKDDFSEV